MQKLKYTLKRDNKIVANNEVDYSIDDGYITFLHEDIIVKLKDSDEFIFIRETKNDYLLVNKDGAFLTLRDNNMSLSIPLVKGELIKNGKKRTLIYQFENDDEFSMDLIFL